MINRKNILKSTLALLCAVSQVMPAGANAVVADSDDMDLDVMQWHEAANGVELAPIGVEPAAIDEEVHAWYKVAQAVEDVSILEVVVQDTSTSESQPSHKSQEANQVVAISTEQEPGSALTGAEKLLSSELIYAKVTHFREGSRSSCFGYRKVVQGVKDRIGFGGSCSGFSDEQLRNFFQEPTALDWCPWSTIALFRFSLADVSKFQEMIVGSDDSSLNNVFNSICHELLPDLYLVGYRFDNVDCQFTRADGQIKLSGPTLFSSTPKPDPNRKGGPDFWYGDNVVP